MLLIVLAVLTVALVDWSLTLLLLLPLALLGLPLLRLLLLSSLTLLALAVVPLLAVSVVSLLLLLLLVSRWRTSRSLLVLFPALSADVLLLVMLCSFHSAARWVLSAR